jgi:Probable zinc-ribbon domain
VKSNKQRRTEILAHRRQREEKLLAAKAHEARTMELLNVSTAPCNPELLAPFNSYGVPPFAARGYYIDTVFQCADCQKQEVWRATQQKWWYEVAKGNVESQAKLCNNCRRVERERKAQARRVHLEGIAKKLAAKSAP